MAARSEVARPARRAFWWSLVLLVPILPLALLVHVGDDWREWRSQNIREPIVASGGAPVRYAGADWTLSRLTRLAGPDPAGTIVFAEFEAEFDDVEAMANAACKVRLLDRTGRSWRSAPRVDPAVGRAMPEAAAKPACGSLAFDGLGKGGTARMAASFLVPAAVQDILLEIDILPARPVVLVFGD